MARPVVVPLEVVPGVGHRIRRAREHRDWTRAQLAVAISLSEQSVMHYELGYRRPSTALCVLIANRLDVPVSDILGSEQ
jgi:DNA-binding XRE family transcriptional regulator